MRLHLSLCAAAFVAVLPSASSTAQQSGYRQDGARPEIIRQLEADLGGAAFDFWTTRLNDYKTRIDNALTRDDLVELERLRVRWAIIIDQSLRAAIAVHDGDTAAVRFDISDMGNAREVMSIYTAARELASRYRPDLDRLSSDVLDDVSAFVGEMAVRVDRFIEANRSSLESDSVATGFLTHRSDLQSVVSDLRSDKTRRGLETIYPLAIEPIVLLFDGSDLKALLTGAMPAGAALPGMEIPEMTALQQNAPNPASTTTSIAYNLPESSVRTSIQLFDGKGALVGEYDLGSVDAGEHRSEVDVSALPAGAYVYRLNAMYGNRGRVYAKVMHVLR